MDAEAFKRAYGESRNGANFFVRHPLVHSFQYSDGVQECAEAGCAWLLDIIGTECLKPLRASGEVLATLNVKVANSKAVLALSVADGAPPAWIRTIDWTDFPKGSWDFLLTDEGERFALILVTEY